MCGPLLDPYPIVTVVIPAYNAARFIGHALQSTLDQTYDRLEIVVVDDGSGDQTAQIVQSYAAKDARVTLLRQRNQGVAAARNRAIRSSSGTFIAPLDADDVWHPEKIERQLESARRGGEKVGLVYTWWYLMSEDAAVRTAWKMPTAQGSVFKQLLSMNFIGCASVPLIRRSCLDEVGLYDVALRDHRAEGCEDWDLALRIAEQYEVRVVPMPLVGYRKVERSMSSNCRIMARSYDVMMEGVLQRHPELPTQRARQHRGTFHSWLARVGYLDGDHAGALWWAVSAVRQHWQTALRWPLLLILVTSGPLALMRPLVASIWPRRRTWIRLRHYWHKRAGKSLPLGTSEQLANNSEGSEVC